jgi:hypothetical protein
MNIRVIGISAIGLSGSLGIKVYYVIRVRKVHSGGLGFRVVCVPRVLRVIRVIRI